VLELSGVQDVLTKVYGSTSAKNVVKATLNGLLKLRSKETIESLRGVEVNAVKRW
jgi:small subunit ribosomal protein S5